MRGQEMVPFKRATDALRAIAHLPDMTLAYRKHAVDRLQQRGLFVLKHGFILEPPVPFGDSGAMAYAMECVCPNGSDRKVRVIVVPDRAKAYLEIVTVMWVDEQEKRAGTMIGGHDE
jgi:hypothetical protein